MTQPRTVRCYEYINRPYADVRRVLREHPVDVFRRATTSAGRRSNEVAASLHASFAGVDVGVDLQLDVQVMREEEGIAGLSPVGRLAVSWKAEHGAALFPIMNAQLSFWPLTSTETQLELEGTYRPPLGFVGNAVDAAVGHRIAEAAVHRFLRETAEQLQQHSVQLRT